MTEALTQANTEVKAQAQAIQDFSCKGSLFNKTKEAKIPLENLLDRRQRAGIHTKQALFETGDR